MRHDERPDAGRPPSGASSASGPVAEWDFRRGPDLGDLVDPGRVLQQAGPGLVTWQADEQADGACLFPGDGSHLRLPPEAVGDLDMSRTGQVTVMALVRRDGLGHGFLAGLWQEIDSDPRRQYGMFLDLPLYGGADQVIGHVSRTGGPSPNLPYSRDYSASARMVGLGAWRVVAFRYDGAEVTSFLDGIADPRPDHTEVGPPWGEGLRHSKNPYVFEDGLYTGPLAEFTVGAVQLSSGIGNAFTGAISRLAVWDRPLTDEEIGALSVQWAPPAAALATFDWWRSEPSPGPTSGGEDGELWAPETAGAQQTTGFSTPIRVAPGRLVRQESSEEAVVELPLVPEAGLIQVEQVAASSTAQVTVRAEAGEPIPAMTCGDGLWMVPEDCAATVVQLRFPAGPAQSIGAVRMRRRGGAAG